MVRNIIEDSDDEGGFGALSPVASRDSSPAPAHPPNEKIPAYSQKSLPGTGSTEELRREIAAAHEDVIAKSAAPNGTTNSPDSTTRWDSPTGSHKRKSTLSSLDSHATSQTKRPDRRKSTRTYGRSDRGDYSLFGEGENAFEFMKQDETVRRRSDRGDCAHQNEDEPPPQTSGEYSAVNQATLPTMPSFLQEDFAGHEPAVMFPMAMSSTIPEATLDQERLLEAARAEYQQNQYHNSPRIAASKFIENPSVSWSDSLEGNERAMRSSQNSSRKSQQPHPGSTNRSQSLRPNESQEVGPQPLNNESNSFPTPRSRVAAKRSCSRTYQSDYDELGERDELGGDPLPDISIASLRQERQSQIEDSPTKSQRAVDQSIQESIRAVRASKAKKERETSTSDALNSEDRAIGLPKERYVPRPSRSRSIRSPMVEPAYSVIPEEAAKLKTKRRKTGDVITVQGHNNTQPESTFTKETIAPATEESAAPPVDVPLSASEKTQIDAPRQKRKRGRPPRKRQAEANNTISDEQHVTSMTEESQIDEVDKRHQVMPSASENQDPEELVTHTGQLLHDPDFRDDGLHERLPSPVVQPSPASPARAVGEVQQVEEPKQKRRGRGRPRSTQNKVRGPAATDVDELRTAVEAPPYNENEKCQEMQPNAGLEDGKSHDLQKTEEDVEEATLGTAGNAGTADDAAPALGSSRSSEEPSEQHEVGANQKVAIKGGSAEPSPLRKGKVPVRVGLSRKARIAPLLKIVRK
ncbi:vacuolar protein sorting-associated protein 11 like [Diplodia corticola]|uniref:Vacuolar protein sorting-associated protein 11 like n=1 Tax=Diplodia corticola TaxID=236234 RepID=A0A1J9R7W0_9PEZI|nr:vacuolar protein sorting-associated protein 11 like [Diplodia corticola]OJD37638.1 vacuolar protein sorting-associated protein 11 like [Diplodia corticola]